MSRILLKPYRLHRKTVQKTVFLTHMRLLATGMLPTLMVAAAFLAFDFGNMVARSMVIYPPLILLLLAWPIWLRLGWSLKRAEWEPAFAEVQAELVDGYFVRRSGHGSEHRLCLRDVQRVQETPEAFLIRANPTLAYYVPKAAFASAEDRERFRSAIEEKILSPLKP
jgi:hypothetical protein